MFLSRWDAASRAKTRRGELHDVCSRSFLIFMVDVNFWNRTWHNPSVVGARVCWGFSGGETFVSQPSQNIHHLNQPSWMFTCVELKNGLRFHFYHELSSFVYKKKLPIPPWHISLGTSHVIHVWYEFYYYVWLGKCKVYSIYMYIPLYFPMLGWYGRWLEPVCFEYSPTVPRGPSRTIYL